MMSKFWRILAPKIAKLVKIKLEKKLKEKEKMHSKKEKKRKKTTGSPSVFFGEKPSLFGYSILPPQFVCTQQMFFPN